MRLRPTIEHQIVEQMEMGVHPPLLSLVPPGIFVVQRHAQPSLERLLQSPVASAFVTPAEQVNQLVSTEPRRGDPRIRPLC